MTDISVSQATTETWEWRCPLCGEAIARSTQVSQRHLIEAHGADEDAFPPAQDVTLPTGYDGTYYLCLACGGFMGTSKGAFIRHLMDAHNCNLDGIDVEEDAQRINATKAAARLAAVHNIDLDDVKGTGHKGRIVKSDIENLIAQ